MAFSVNSVAKPLRPAMPTMAGRMRIALRDYARAGIVGGVGVLDMDRDAGLADGEDGLVMQHGRAHVRQFALLPIGDFFDRAGIVNEARVGHQHAGHIRPVLVNRGMDGAGDDGPGHIRAAAREAFDLPLRVLPVKAGNDGDFVFGNVGQSRPEPVIGLGGMEPPVRAEAYPVRSVHKLGV